MLAAQGIESQRLWRPEHNMWLDLENAQLARIRKRRGSVIAGQLSHLELVYLIWILTPHVYDSCCLSMHAAVVIQFQVFAVGFSLI